MKIAISCALRSFIVEVLGSHRAVKDDTGISRADALTYWHAVDTEDGDGVLDPEMLAQGRVKFVDGAGHCANCGKELLTARTGDDYENTRHRRVSGGVVYCAGCGKPHPIKREQRISDRDAEHMGLERLPAAKTRKNDGRARR